MIKNAISFPHHLCRECKWREVTPITGVDHKTLNIFKCFCCSQGGKNQPRKHCIFSISLQPLSLSTLEIHINSTNIYGWTFVKHQSESDLGRNKMSLLLFANYFWVFSCCLTEINWFFHYHAVGKITYCRHHHELCRNHRTDMTWHYNIMYCLGCVLQFGT